jgi:hypothetical protein
MEMRCPTGEDSIFSELPAKTPDGVAITNEIAGWRCCLALFACSYLLAFLLNFFRNLP